MMIALSKYQLAEMEIRLIYFRYQDLNDTELKQSKLISDMEDFLKKWCNKIPNLKKTRKCLYDELKSSKDAEDDKEKLDIYKNYIEYIFTELYTINALSIDEKATRISSKIVDGIEKYCYNHY